MPVVERPDGVEIHYRVRGRGPAVVMAPHAAAYPGVYGALADELARDLRVVEYDPRGCGESTRTPPVGPQEDDDDLAALIGAIGGRAILVAWGDAALRGVRLAAADGELLPAIVAAGANALGGGTLRDSPALASSEAVRESVQRLAQSDARSAIRMLLELANPEMTPAAMRERINATLAYCDPATMLRRNGWFYGGDEIERARALGPRLWIVHWPSIWSPEEVSGHLRRLLPDAHVRSIGEGAISRPDLTADVVRRAVAAAEKRE